MTERPLQTQKTTIKQPDPPEAIQQVKETWAVTVERNGESILTLAIGHLSGRDFIEGDEDTIRTVARHLLAFIGDPDLESQLTAIQGERDQAQTIVDAYAAAARVIGLHLREWMDESLPYDEAIAEAARRVAAELLDNRACNLSTWKQRAEHAEGERDALREALKQIVDADFLKVEGVRQPIWVRWNHALAIAKATLHTGGCNGLARGDGNGQGADGVVYPGDPAHCLSCALQPSKEER